MLRLFYSRNNNRSNFILHCVTPILMQSVRCVRHTLEGCSATSWGRWRGATVTHIWRETACVHDWFTRVSVIAAAASLIPLWPPLACVRQLKFYPPDASELIARCHLYCVDALALALIWSICFWTMSSPMSTWWTTTLWFDFSFDSFLSEGFGLF